MSRCRLTSAVELVRIAKKKIHTWQEGWFVPGRVGAAVVGAVDEAGRLVHVLLNQQTAHLNTVRGGAHGRCTN